MPTSKPLSFYLAESRILPNVEPMPVLKALIRLAELIMRDGFVKDSLAFYSDLSGQANTPIARAGEAADSSPLAVYQVSSATVRKPAVALALSPGGIKLRRGQTVALLMLVAIPEGGSSLNLALPSKAVQMFAEAGRRSLLAPSPDGRSALAKILEFEKTIPPPTGSVFLTRAP